MIKGEQQLTNYLDNWLKQNGFECTTELGEEFAWWRHDEKISYALLVSENHYRLFPQVTDKLGLVLDCDNFLLSFFHELGHCETDELISVRKANRYQRIKDRIANKKTLKDKDYFKYYYLPDEIIATNWAVNYINTHTVEIARFWNEVAPLIFNIYEQNELAEAIG